MRKAGAFAQCSSGAPVTAGDEHLSRVLSMQEVIPAGLIQLAQHIIQQNDGRFAQCFFHYPALGQL